MRSVIALAPETHDQIRAQAGYRVEIRDCPRCWREIHVYVPAEGAVALGGLVIEIRCPHCLEWKAETLIRDASRPVFVRACRRSELAWLARDLKRGLRINVARARVVVAWPYWAVYRLRLSLHKPPSVKRGKQ